MMDRATDEFDRATRRVSGDLKTMIADSEDLLKAAAMVSDESVRTALKKFEEKLKGAKSSLAEMSRPMLDMSSRAAAETDGYVHGNPWTAIGIAAAAGVVIGLLVARR
jgi:ElaB/YqjD/DUF883 family membrane-anchored ribosome-binding protein